MHETLIEPSKLTHDVILTQAEKFILRQIFARNQTVYVYSATRNAAHPQTDQRLPLCENSQMAALGRFC